MRRRYERMFKDRDSAEAMSDEAARAAADAREAANAAARTAFHGSIATVFTKHLRQGRMHAACLFVQGYCGVEDTEDQFWSDRKHL